MRDAPVKSGEILAGKYRIDRVLGAGAMGMVVAATHIGLGSRVAVKFMFGGGKAQREMEERFLREARIANMVRSQHAAKVLDIGTLSSGAPYIVMEFLAGKDLASLLQERGPLTVDDAVTYILQACEAIAEAHGLGIVHRDIKPANLFLTTDADGSPNIKVVDFGISKVLESDLALTGTAQALGSPLYMSPEQVNAARDVDGRADIWALGITLYELLAQTTPFHADTMMALMARLFQGTPTPLEQFRPDVPPGVAAVIMQCLERDRQRRWPSVAAFAAALAPYAPARSARYVEHVAGVQKADIAPSRPTALLPAPPVEALVVAPQALVRASPAVAEPRARGGRGRAALITVVAVAALVAALVTGLVFGLRAHERGPEAATIATAQMAPPPVPSATAETTAITLPPAEPSATAAPSASSRFATTAAAPTSAPRPRPPAGAAVAKPASTWGGPRR